MTWLMAAELLTVEDALYLPGWSEPYMRWVIAEGVVIANDGDDDYLIDRDNLHEAMEWRAFVYAWTRKPIGGADSEGARPTAS